MTPKYEIVQPVRIRAMCECGGEYLPSGRDDLTHKKIGHRCNNCGAEIRTETKFPAIEHFTDAELKALAQQIA